jgi:uncharacterized RmlC-like cupin family protein
MTAIPAIIATTSFPAQWATTMKHMRRMPAMVPAAALLACAVPVQDSTVDTHPAPAQEIVVVRAPPGIMTRQRLPGFVGISGKTAGARALSMNLVVIPPGASAEPHYHAGYESAVYLLEGRVETRYGQNLEHSVVNEAGDFIFIPPDLPHQPVNLDPDKPARAIVVRNDPAEQEHVVIYRPAGR